MIDSAVWMGFFTIIAILVGPVIAIQLTRWLDRRGADKERKLAIFRTLMRTRGLRLHQDHVEALNLVEVEFIKRKKVVEAWKEYFSHLCADPSPVDDNVLLLSKERDELLTRLISEIAAVLDIKIEQLDILRKNYVPQGWADDDWQQRVARMGLINVLYGRAPIAVRPYAPEQTDGPYPPTPSQTTDSQT